MRISPHPSNNKHQVWERASNYTGRLPRYNLALLTFVGVLAISIGLVIGSSGEDSDSVILMFLALAGSGLFLVAFKSPKTIMLVCLLTALPVSITIGFEGMKGIYPYEVLLIFLLLTLLLTRIVRGRARHAGQPTEFGSTERSMLLLSGWVVLGYLMNIGSYTNLGWKFYAHGMLTLVLCLGAYFMGKYLFDDSTDFKRVCWAILVATLIPSLLVMIAWLQQTSGVIGRYNFVLSGDLGYGDHASLALIGFLIALSLLASVSSRIERIALMFCLSVYAIPLIIIGTRAIYVYALGEIVLLLILLRPWARQHTYHPARVVLPALLAIAFLGFMIYFVFNTDLIISIRALLSPGSYELANKKIMIQTAYHLLLEHPFFGVGLGFYPIYSLDPILVSGGSVYVASPHNGVMQLLAETGIGGFMIAMLVCFFFLVQSWKSYCKLSSPLFRSLAAAVMVIVLFAVVGQLIQSSLFFPPAAQRNSIRIPFYAWFLVGYVQGLRRIESRLLQKCKVRAE
ncbi:MAG: O-antigen ligase family protein [Planctomycetota bacterium]